MKNTFRRFLNRFGLDVVRYVDQRERNLNINEELNYELEEKCYEHILKIKKNTMLSKRRLVTLFQQVVYCETAKIQGCFVECGVWKGGAMGLMALGNLDYGKERRVLHLYDSFADICEPDDKVDGLKAIKEVEEFSGTGRNIKGKLKSIEGIYESLGGPGTLSENVELLENIINYPRKSINYHKGWFQDTIPQSSKEIDKIAILRLDGDWYASTKICLEYLYPKVVVGGVVIIDDYGTYDGCKRAFDEYARHNDINCYLSSVDSDCRFLIKR